MSLDAPKQKRRRLILLSSIILLALICWAYFAPSELDRYKAQLIAQGEILDLDKLAPKRTGNEPDGDAPLLAAQQQITNGFTLRSGRFAFEHTDRGIQYLQWHNLGGSTNPPNWTNAVAEINSRKDDFLLLHQLLKDPPKEKGGDYRDFLNYKYADPQLRGRIADHVHHATILSAYTGDGDMTFTNLTTLLSLAQLHRKEWEIRNQSDRCLMTMDIWEDLNYCLNLRLWGELQLADLQVKIESLSLVTNTIHALIMERARVSALFAMARRDPEAFITDSFTQPMSSRDKFRTTYWRHLDIANDEFDHLNLSQVRLNIFREQLSSPAWAGAIKPLWNLHDKARHSTVTWWTDNKFTLTEMCFHDIGNASTLAYAETRRQQAITVLALERYRLKHARYPDTLTQLIPDHLANLPQDPMDGRPMRYRLNPDATFTLWSSGFDGKDNGGDPTVPAHQNRRFPTGALDLTWPRIDPADLPPKP
ncbi:MAG: hypothetical protein K0Q55_387 [Verrucomicrobia bacterium]|jgi:hypothetical protein|nr:hypothetical protein [Verrucomicrobiota bacterium]